MLDMSSAVVLSRSESGAEKGHKGESAGVITAKANCCLCVNIRGQEYKGKV